MVAEGRNGRILYAARGGATREQLGVTDEQLSTLLEFGLLDWHGDRLRTTFPVLGSSEMTALRAHLRELAIPLVDAIENPSRLIVVELDRIGLRQSDYALVFGYGLDLLLWEPLKDAGVVPATGLTPECPWWSGAFWAIYPPRAGSAGTNFLDCGEGVTLVMVWSDETAKALDAFAVTPGVRAGLRALARGREGHVSASGSASADARSRLRLPDGRPALPIVGIGGQLDELARRVAGPVAAVLAGDGADPARGFVPTDDRAVATVVVAHELTWELTDQLVARGVCRVPDEEDLMSRMLLMAGKPDATSAVPES